MANTVEEMNVRKAVLSYFCQETTSDNLVLLKQSLEQQDAEGSGMLTHE